MVSKASKKKAAGKTAGRARVVNMIKTIKKARKAAKTGVRGPETEYMKLLVDPCRGPLIRTSGPTGITERVRTTVTLPGQATSTCGYFIWYPGYSSWTDGTSVYSGQSCFWFENANPAVPPTNSIAVPLGSGASNVTGSFYPDPMANNIAIGSAFVRQKTLSACLQFEWLGALSATQGQIAIVKNFSLSAFNRNAGSVNGLQPPTVDQVFGYAEHRSRLMIDGAEVIWRPTTAQSVFRANDAEENGVFKSILPDSCFWAGQAGVSASGVVATNPADQMGICIAWKGFTAAAATCQFNLIKVGALELRPANAMIEPPMTTGPEAAVDVDKVVKSLDGRFKWQIPRKVAEVGYDLAGKAATSFFNYAIPRVYTGPSGYSRTAGPSLRLMDR